VAAVLKRADTADKTAMLTFFVFFVYAVVGFGKKRGPNSQ
jgi:hypothetical protein